MAAASTTSDTLFFIPDIGGFTRFVTETEVSHSQHIVKELLERLVDANQLGMQVAEFEGDAVQFTRKGSPPSLADLLAQARRMYVAFHSHLKQFELLMRRKVQTAVQNSLDKLAAIMDSTQTVH